MADDTRPADAEEPARKHAYVAPAVSWEQPFDAQAGLASACGKIAGQGDQCDTSPAS
jgi:hypothetical protein